MAAEALALPLDLPLAPLAALLLLLFCHAHLPARVAVGGRWVVNGECWILVVGGWWVVVNL